MKMGLGRFKALCGATEKSEQGLLFSYRWRVTVLAMTHNRRLRFDECGTRKGTDDKGNFVYENHIGRDPVQVNGVYRDFGESQIAFSSFVKVRFKGNNSTYDVPLIDTVTWTTTLLTKRADMLEVKLNPFILCQVRAWNITKSVCSISKQRFCSSKIDFGENRFNRKNFRWNWISDEIEFLRQSGFCLLNFWRKIFCPSRLPTKIIGPNF